MDQLVASPATLEPMCPASVSGAPALLPLPASILDSLEALAGTGQAATITVPAMIMNVLDAEPGTGIAGGTSGAGGRAVTAEGGRQDEMSFSNLVALADEAYRNNDLDFAKYLVRLIYRHHDSKVAHRAG